MANNTIGYGSFFHCDTAAIQSLAPDSGFEAQKLLFYAGRYAMKYIFQLVQSEREIKTIWLPEYYCPFVKNWLSHEFENLAYYATDPFNSAADIDFTRFDNTDLVVVNNYWGIKDLTLPKQRNFILIEDHSHAWGSHQSKHSEADFCIASLRKTIPVALGGIAWKPAKSPCTIPLEKRQLFENDTDEVMYRAWRLFETAMKQKAHYNGNGEEKIYLNTYAKAENTLREHYSVTEIRETHRTTLEKALFKNYNHPKKHNIAKTVELLNPSAYFKVLHSKAYVPFGLLLVFRDKQTLLALKQHLIHHAIYPADLWPDNDIAQVHKYLLNIHLDYRYGEKDVQYITKIINEWSERP